MGCINYQKSSLIANSSNQTIAAATNIVFNNYSTSGISIRQNSTSGATIIRPGLYYISFNGSAVNTTTTSGNIIAQLINNGISQSNINCTATSASTDDIVSLQFDTILQINNCQINSNNGINISVLNNGIEALYNVANLTIIKLA